MGRKSKTCTKWTLFMLENFAREYCKYPALWDIRPRPKCTWKRFLESPEIAKICKVFKMTPERATRDCGLFYVKFYKELVLVSYKALKYKCKDVDVALSKALAVAPTWVRHTETHLQKLQSLHHNRANSDVHNLEMELLSCVRRNGKVTHLKQFPLPSHTLQHAWDVLVLSSLRKLDKLLSASGGAELSALECRVVRTALGLGRRRPPPVRLLTESVEHSRRLPQPIAWLLLRAPVAPSSTADWHHLASDFCRSVCPVPTLVVQRLWYEAVRKLQLQIKSPHQMPSWNEILCLKMFDDDEVIFPDEMSEQNETGANSDSCVPAMSSTSVDMSASQSDEEMEPLVIETDSEEEKSENNETNLEHTSPLDIRQDVKENTSRLVEGEKPSTEPTSLLKIKAHNKEDNIRVKEGVTYYNKESRKPVKEKQVAKRRATLEERERNGKRTKRLVELENPSTKSNSSSDSEEKKVDVENTIKLLEIIQPHEMKTTLLICSDSDSDTFEANQTEKAKLSYSSKNDEDNKKKVRLEELVNPTNAPSLIENEDKALSSISIVNNSITNKSREINNLVDNCKPPDDKQTASNGNDTNRNQIQFENDSKSFIDVDDMCSEDFTKLKQQITAIGIRSYVHIDHSYVKCEGDNKSVRGDSSSDEEPVALIDPKIAMLPTVKLVDLIHSPSWLNEHLNGNSNYNLTLTLKEELAQLNKLPQKTVHYKIPGKNKIVTNKENVDSNEDKVATNNKVAKKDKISTTKDQLDAEEVVTGIDMNSKKQIEPEPRYSDEIVKLLKLCREVRIELVRCDAGVVMGKRDSREAKRVKLPSIDEVRRINSHILTAQVAPLGLLPTNESKDRDRIKKTKKRTFILDSESDSSSDDEPISTYKSMENRPVSPHENINRNETFASKSRVIYSNVNGGLKMLIIAKEERSRDEIPNMDNNKTVKMKLKSRDGETDMAKDITDQIRLKSPDRETDMTKDKTARISLNSHKEKMDTSRDKTDRTKLKSLDKETKTNKGMSDGIRSNNDSINLDSGSLSKNMEPQCVQQKNPEIKESDTKDVHKQISAMLMSYWYPVQSKRFMEDVDKIAEKPLKKPKTKKLAAINKESVTSSSKPDSDMAEWIRQKNIAATVYGLKPRANPSKPPLSTEKANHEPSTITTHAVSSNQNVTLANQNRGTVITAAPRAIAPKQNAVLTTQAVKANQTWPPVHSLNLQSYIVLSSPDNTTIAPNTNEIFKESPKKEVVSSLKTLLLNKETPKSVQPIVTIDLDSNSDMSDNELVIDESLDKRSNDTNKVLQANYAKTKEGTELNLICAETFSLEDTMNNTQELNNVVQNKVNNTEPNKNSCTDDNERSADPDEPADEVLPIITNITSLATTPGPSVTRPVETQDSAKAHETRSLLNVLLVTTPSRTPATVNFEQRALNIATHKEKDKGKFQNPYSAISRVDKVTSGPSRSFQNVPQTKQTKPMKQLGRKLVTEKNNDTIKRNQTTGPNKGNVRRAPIILNHFLGAQKSWNETLAENVVDNLDMAKLVLVGKNKEPTVMHSVQETQNQGLTARHSVQETQNQELTARHSVQETQNKNVNAKRNVLSIRADVYCNPQKKSLLALCTDGLALPCTILPHHLVVTSADCAPFANPFYWTIDENCGQVQLIILSDNSESQIPQNSQSSLNENPLVPHTTSDPRAGSVVRDTKTAPEEVNVVGQSALPLIPVSEVTLKSNEQVQKYPRIKVRDFGRCFDQPSIQPSQDGTRDQFVSFGNVYKKLRQFPPVYAQVYTQITDLSLSNELLHTNAALYVLNINTSVLTRVRPSQDERPRDILDAYAANLLEHVLTSMFSRMS